MLAGYNVVIYDISNDHLSIVKDTCRQFAVPLIADGICSQSDLDMAKQTYLIVKLVTKKTIRIRI